MGFFLKFPPVSGSFPPDVREHLRSRACAAHTPLSNTYQVCTNSYSPPPRPRIPDNFSAIESMEMRNTSWSHDAGSLPVRDHHTRQLTPAGTLAQRISLMTIIRAQLLKEGCKVSYPWTQRIMSLLDQGKSIKSSRRWEMLSPLPFLSSRLLFLCFPEGASSF